MEPDRPIEPIYREPDRPAAPAPRGRPTDWKAVLTGLGALLLIVAVVLIVATVVIWWWRTVIG